MKILLALPLILMMSCQSTQKSNATPKKTTVTSTTADINKKWMLSTLKDSSKEELDKNKAYIEFSNGKGSASVGCNTLNFPYKQNGNQLTVENLFSTRMLCNDLATQEASLASELKNISSFTIEGNTLTITTSSGSKIIANHQ